MSVIQDTPSVGVVNTKMPVRYRGRFAPTPSGPLHMGSLLTALASWLEARAQGGDWLLRIDDLDRERCPPGASTLILQQLEAHDLQWDERPRYQSEHLDDYDAALQRLIASGRIYACACTRATLQQHVRHGPDGPVYDGSCRELALPYHGHALRLRVEDEDIAFVDGWQGSQTRRGTTDVSDFIVVRRDGIPGYQLSCAVDEVQQRITHVVRGADLLGSTFAQRHVLDALDLPMPAYRHLPVLVNATGMKLSKQNHAKALDSATAPKNLWQCLQWLGQNPPASLAGAQTHDVLTWALAFWKPHRVPHATCIKVEQHP